MTNRKEKISTHLSYIADIISIECVDDNEKNAVADKCANPHHLSAQPSIRTVVFNRKRRFLFATVRTVWKLKNPTQLLRLTFSKNAPLSILLEGRRW